MKKPKGTGISWSEVYPVTVVSFNLVDLSFVGFSDCLKNTAGDGIGIAL